MTSLMVITFNTLGHCSARPQVHTKFAANSQHVLTCFRQSVIKRYKWRFCKFCISNSRSQPRSQN